MCLPHFVSFWSYDELIEMQSSIFFYTVYPVKLEV